MEQVKGDPGSLISFFESKGAELSMPESPENEDQIREGLRKITADFTVCYVRAKAADKDGKMSDHTERAKEDLFTDPRYEAFLRKCGVNPQRKNWQNVLYKDGAIEKHMKNMKAIIHYYQTLSDDYDEKGADRTNAVTEWKRVWEQSRSARPKCFNVYEIEDLDGLQRFIGTLETRAFMT